MDIRSPRDDEIGVVVDELWLSLARSLSSRDDHYELVEDPVAVAKKYLSQMHSADKSVVLVAASDDELIGFASGQLVQSMPYFERGPDFHLVELYVSEGNRRSGVATELLETLRDRAKELGAETLTTNTHVDNQAANEFFASRGVRKRSHDRTSTLSDGT